MAIEGPVRELALSDLLQLLFLSRRTGNLVVRDESTGHTVMLELEGGALASASSTNPEMRLGRLLVGSGRATDGQIAAAVRAQASRPGSRLGEVLVEQGAVRASEVRRHLRLQVEEAVFDLMRWENGHLRFEEQPPRRTGAIEVRLPTDIVLMDSARRLDEWVEVTANSPEPDPLPRLVASIGASSGQPLTLTPIEWEVLAKVDGENTLRRIARSLGRPELEVARAIYSLASVGVVEVGSRVPAPVGPSPEDLEGDLREAENAIQSGRLSDADRLTERLLHRAADYAPAHLLRGRLRASADDYAAAVSSFERAIGLDPLLAPAYFHLARAAVRTGDLAAARNALDTYMKLPDSTGERREAAKKMGAGLNLLLDALNGGAT